MNLQVTELSRALGWGRALGALDVMLKNLDLSMEMIDSEQITLAATGRGDGRVGHWTTGREIRWEMIAVTLGREGNGDGELFQGSHHWCVYCPVQSLCPYHFGAL